MPTSSLKGKTVSGVTWAAVEKWGQQIIQFIITIIIARILSPADYGIVGILTVFLMFSNVLIDSGFGAALIQRKEVTETDYSTVFYFNLFISIACYGLLYLAAPAIARFFNEPQLVPIARVLGTTIVINSFALIQMTILQKRLEFKPQAYVALAAVIVSGAVGVAMAYRGFGLWALVGQSIVSAVVQALLYWVFSAWRPLFVFSRTSISSLFGFSSNLLASSLLNVVFRSIIPVLIGKYYSTRDLGFYTQSKRFNDLPSVNTTLIVQKVSYATLATIQDDDARLKAAYRRIIQSVAFIVFPAMLILAATARPAILLLLTAKWEPSVIYLQILAFGGMLYPLHSITLNICQIKGRTDIFLKLEVAKKAITLFFILAAIPFGVLAFVIAETIVSIISYFLNAKYNGDLIDYPLKEQIADIVPMFLISIATAAAVGAIGLIGTLPLAVLLAVQLSCAVALYLPLSRLFKVPAFLEWHMLVRDRFAALKRFGGLK
ncbi:MAG TPA: lipopolysaccharide biosynthesis protein [bacterium]|nr:lipopolysaccharide biosynthesis protein [bacterium]